jgi:hypothetical protein
VLPAGFRYGVERRVKDREDSFKLWPAIGKTEARKEKGNGVITDRDDVFKNNISTVDLCWTVCILMLI